MINIFNKSNCCGCASCVQRCPKQCINLNADDEGFLYPIVHKDACINCGLCEKSCPMENERDSTQPLSVFAAKACDDEVRLQSSSGGIFSLLATSILQEGGIVFGAAFDDNFNVHHVSITDDKDLKLLQGSKYVQSNIGNTYHEAELALKKGKRILFSGTPCQIAGLKQYLQKDYDNLLAIDIVCHGVPSPLVWNEYKKTIPAKRVDGKNTVLQSLKEMPVLTGISFRDKRNGWQKYGFAAHLSACGTDKNSVLQHYEPKSENIYMKGFLSNIFLRPSCYSCKFNNGRSQSDISLADYWGIQNVVPELYDEKGVSCVLIHTHKGFTAFKKLKLKSTPTTLSDFLSQNPVYQKSTKMPQNRIAFWESLPKVGIERAILKYSTPPIKDRIRSRLIQIAVDLGVLSYIKKLLNK